MMFNPSETEVIHEPMGTPEGYPSPPEPASPPFLTAQPEPFGPFLAEVQPLLPRHYEELSLHKDRFDLNPQFGEYARRDAGGMVLCVTLRSQGRLVGYFVGFVAPGLHYADCLTLTTDIFWLAPEQRGQRGGVKLFKAVEAEARRRGVKLIMGGSKNHHDTSRLFSALGYEPVETWHAKWID